MFSYIWTPLLKKVQYFCTAHVLESPRAAGADCFEVHTQQDDWASASEIATKHHDVACHSIIAQGTEKSEAIVYTLKVSYAVTIPGKSRGRLINDKFICLL